MYGEFEHQRQEMDALGNAVWIEGGEFVPDNEEQPCEDDDFLNGEDQASGDHGPHDGEEDGGAQPNL